MFSTIQKWGNSSAIRLPKTILKSANFQENNSVEIIANENEIIIRKVILKPYITLKERIKNYDNSGYVFEEAQTGPPVGNEVF